MAHRISRWRWRLAHRIAPAPIMADPFPGAEALVVYRKDGSTVAIRLHKMRLRITTSLPSFKGYEDGATTFARSGTLVRLVGTVDE